ncbi:MAG: hypothetical protein J6V95_06635, partial [Bacteroidaceae bacterium]|nr:hypothetical protein [Bacteroidaceae bacterium]
FFRYKGTPINLQPGCKPFLPPFREFFVEERNERNSNKTVKPADETEAIADVIIREKEIAAGK